MIVKVFNASANALPEKSTPASAAKDVRAHLGAVKDAQVFGGRIVELPIGSETGFSNIVVKDFSKDPVIEGESIKALVLIPGGRALIPSGLTVELPTGFSMDVRPRSGLSLKYGIELVNSPGLIDNDYRGDCGIIIKNGGFQNIQIIDGDRVGQLKLSSDLEFEWELVDSKDKLSSTKRADGGFNSTGTK